eukprot:6208655-Pleurochrysis_carterae.AAC.2
MPLYVEAGSRSRLQMFRWLQKGARDSARKGADRALGREREGARLNSRKGGCVVNGLVDGCVAGCRGYHGRVDGCVGGYRGYHGRIDGCGEGCLIARRPTRLLRPRAAAAAR